MYLQCHDVGVFARDCETPRGYLEPALSLLVLRLALWVGSWRTSGQAF